MRLSFYVATLITLIAFNTQAATRSETIGVLDSMTSNWPQANLRVWLNDGEQQIQLGSKVEYHFQADQDAYLTVLHVDTLGQGTLLFPSGLETGNQLQAGVKRTFPGQREGFDLNATEPQGAENVYVIAAKHAITPEELGISIAPDEMKSLDESATMRFAKQLKSVVSGRPAGSVAVARIDQQIVEYTAGTLTRSIRRQKIEAPHKQPEIPLHLSFELDSSELGPAAKSQLDALGKAMRDSPGLYNQIELDGHTCDLGPDEFNLQLSRDRAGAAKQYLISNFGVSPSSVATKGLGESQPASSGTSESARKDNRRVVLKVGE